MCGHRAPTPCNDGRLYRKHAGHVIDAGIIPWRTHEEPQLLPCTTRKRPQGVRCATAKATHCERPTTSRENDGCYKYLKVKNHFGAYLSCCRRVRSACSLAERSFKDTDIDTKRRRGGRVADEGYTAGKRVPYGAKWREGHPGHHVSIAEIHGCSQVWAPKSTLAT